MGEVVWVREEVVAVICVRGEGNCLGEVVWVRRGVVWRRGGCGCRMGGR